MKTIITLKKNKIYEIGLDNEKLWKKLVISNPNHDVYYLPEYLKAFEQHGDGTPIMFYYYTDTFSVLNVAMKRDIAKIESFKDKVPESTYFDLATPYGYGGFITNGTPTEVELSEFNNKYEEYCFSNGIVSEFVRFHPVLSNSDLKIGTYEIQELGKTVTIDLSSEEVVWANFDAKNRNMIRKSQKNGVRIFWGRDWFIFENFISLYNQTMQRDNAKDYYFFKEDFYKSILMDLKYNSMIFYAQYEGNIIAAAILLFANGKMHYHLSGSNRDFQYLAPTNLLLYEAAIWGGRNNFKTLHLGGGLGSNEDQLYKFKRVFNKNSNSKFSLGKKVFIPNVYKELTSEVGIIYKEYFPAYRGS